MPDQSPKSNRREFLSGNAARKELECTGNQIADELADKSEKAPSSGDTVRLSTRAMACEFTVILNPGNRHHVIAASDALEVVHELEQQLSVYRDSSDLSQLNRTMHEAPVEADCKLFELLFEAYEIWSRTGGAFNPCSGQLIQLWRRCRAENRLPSEQEIGIVLGLSDPEMIEFDRQHHAVCSKKEGIAFDLGGIGKGYALDEAGRHLETQGVGDFLFHGGHSSILSRGGHNRIDGWPIGIRNPLFPDRRLGTLILKNAGFSASGSGVQYFRHEGKRFGHILDPRSGWPSDEMLSVAVIAPEAAIADALSTAFFVLGLEKSLEYCDNYGNIQALLIPKPKSGRTLTIEKYGVDEASFFLESD